MPIKLQNSAQVKDYVPYSTNGEMLVEDINDMVSYDVEEPERSIDLQFIFGATNTVVKTFNFKNLTKNQLLTITAANYDSNAYSITPNPLLLQPEQTGSMTLLIVAENMQVGITNQLTNLKFEIENTRTPTTPALTFKASGSAAEPLGITTLDKTITVYE